ncbi:hypothetical protein RND81_11G124800 [Saponaria officinalis]|uniref:Uncharacterized protein n=1 Tax=Saponaria officinalis TaxID=3572 RepID=A0AAW1HKA1_SAPOF
MSTNLGFEILYITLSLSSSLVIAVRKKGVFEGQLSSSLSTSSSSWEIESSDSRVQQLGRSSSSVGDHKDELIYCDDEDGDDCGCEEREPKVCWTPKLKVFAIFV